ncbi:hypothetical protein [Inquilinus sp.]|jgi:hypothetical protein|uniref:hypothetical protein n=1 Tax=Inquilinus sp. TaxID=1932117 RepID=UPI003783C82D
MDITLPPASARSRRHRPDDVTRNPILALPSLQRLLDLPAEDRAHLEALLRDFAYDARARAEHSWRSRKAPMAAYRHAIAVYSRHIARAVSPGRRMSARLRPGRVTERAMPGDAQLPGILLTFPKRPSP